MGLGHIIRSLALAEMLQTDYNCHFIIKTPLPSIKQVILSKCISIIELPEQTKEEAIFLSTHPEIKGDIIVLDGYHFRTAYQKQFKNTGWKVVCIDDICAYPFVADAIINHAGGIQPHHYNTSSYTRHYLGLKYALLRRPFREAALFKTYPERTNAVFICLGGADPKNDTLEVLKNCLKHPIEQCYVVIGQAYKYKKQLEKFVQTATFNIVVLSNLSAEQVAYYMKRCNKAITSPSTVSYEYLSIGGELYLKQIADNQDRIYAYYLEQHLAVDYTAYPLTEPRIVSRMLENQKSLFDGQQQTRFKQLFKELFL